MKQLETSKLRNESEMKESIQLAADRFASLSRSMNEANAAVTETLEKRMSEVEQQRKLLTAAIDKYQKEAKQLQ